MIRRISVAVMAILFMSCMQPVGLRNPAIRDDAFEQGRINTRTIENSDAHKAGIIVAILPFKNNTTEKKLDGPALVDLISARLAGRKAFKLVERNRIEEIMSELRLGDGGVVDESTAVRIGGMLGANVMVFGGVSDLGKKMTLTLRLVKVETAEIVGGVSESGSASNLEALAASAAERLFETLRADNGQR